MEKSDKWKELFASGDSFALQRLLSELDPKDLNLTNDELLKLDSFKFDAQAINDLVSENKNNIFYFGKFRNYNVITIIIIYFVFRCDLNLSIN